MSSISRVPLALRHAHSSSFGEPDYPPVRRRESEIHGFGADVLRLQQEDEVLSVPVCVSRKTATSPALQRSWYLTIEGAIGVGKTTLARMLRDRFDCGLLLEVLEENPFLADFYKSSETLAFQTQMFFLASRYWQLRQVPRLLQRGALISDYMFSKDWLFARLNLKGDEWEVYDRLHSALAEQVANPDLVVYLQADTDVLMRRVAQRGRPYERDMDRSYIEAVRKAYEGFFRESHSTRILPVNTNELDIVTRLEDLQLVISRIAGTLRENTSDKDLPDFEISLLE